MISIVRNTNKGTRVSRVGNTPHLQTAVLAGAKTPQMGRFAKNPRVGQFANGILQNSHINVNLPRNPALFPPGKWGLIRT